MYLGAKWVPGCGCLKAPGCCKREKITGMTHLYAFMSDILVRWWMSRAPHVTLGRCTSYLISAQGPLGWAHGVEQKAGSTSGRCPERCHRMNVTFTTPVTFIKLAVKPQGGLRAGDLAVALMLHGWRPRLLSGTDVAVLLTSPGSLTK